MAKTQENPQRILHILGFARYRYWDYEFQLHPVVSSDVAFRTARFGSDFSDAFSTFSC